MSQKIALTTTALLVIGTIIWASTAGLTLSDWLIMFQSLGAMVALMWIVYTAFLQERTSNRDVVLQSLALIKSDLEDLMKSIEVEMGALKSRAGYYEERFLRGERTAYIGPLTAGNGDRLRRLYRAKNNDAPNAQFLRLDRRLRTYVAMFDPVRSMAERDATMLEIIEASPHGRAYLAIKAALAKSDGEAAVFMTRLKAHDTGALLDTDTANVTTST